MESGSSKHTVTLPTALLAQIQAAADEEHRPVAELLRELIERGLAERRWRSHAEKERERARELGLPDDDQPMSSEYRQTMRDKIAQGLQSLREGRGADGEAFLAEMEAEMDELERQGHK